MDRAATGRARRRGLRCPFHPLAAGAPTLAAAADFSGKWAVNGHIVASRGYVLASPIRDFRQNGAQVAGSCRGPNGGGDAAGLASGAEISFQWRTAPSNAIGLRGVASFNDALGPDGIIRGTWSFLDLAGRQRPVHRAAAVRRRGAGVTRGYRR